MYDKEFYEKYAKASLEFFYGEKLKNFVLAECPDLQNDTDNIGVEVTRGISQYVGKMSRLANECMENNLTFDQKISRANRMFRKNFLGIIHESGAFVIADPQNGVDSYEIHMKFFQHNNIKDRMPKTFRSTTFTLLMPSIGFM